MWTQISCWMQGLSLCVLLISVGWFSFCGYEGTQDHLPCVHINESPHAHKSLGACNYVLCWNGCFCY